MSRNNLVTVKTDKGRNCIRRIRFKILDLSQIKPVKNVKLKRNLQRVSNPKVHGSKVKKNLVESM